MANEANSRTILQATAVIWMRDDGGLNKGDINGSDMGTNGQGTHFIFWELR